jgi:hypothetical protein
MRARWTASGAGSLGAADDRAADPPLRPLEAPGADPPPGKPGPGRTPTAPAEMALVVPMRLVSFQRAGWRLISGGAPSAVILGIVVILCIVIALVFGATTAIPYVYFFKRLPTDEVMLTKLAERLGVSMSGTAETFTGKTGTNIYEVQRRVMEAIRLRRDSLAWVVAVLAALASAASAVAAWIAASMPRPN